MAENTAQPESSDDELARLARAWSEGVPSHERVPDLLRQARVATRIVSRYVAQRDAIIAAASKGVMAERAKAASSVAKFMEQREAIVAVASKALIADQVRATSSARFEAQRDAIIGVMCQALFRADVPQARGTDDLAELVDDLVDGHRGEGLDAGDPPHAGEAEEAAVVLQLTPMIDFLALMIFLVLFWCYLVQLERTEESLKDVNQVEFVATVSWFVTVANEFRRRSHALLQSRQGGAD